LKDVYKELHKYNFTSGVSIVQQLNKVEEELNEVRSANSYRETFEELLDLLLAVTNAVKLYETSYISSTGASEVVDRWLDKLEKYKTGKHKDKAVRGLKDIEGW